MKHFKNGDELAKEMGIPASSLKSTFDKYNSVAENKNDPWGKKFFDAMPYSMSDSFNVAIITPVLHYCMGGLHADTESQVVGANGSPIPGLFAAGEVVGGVHGEQRLGGSSLLDCVVFGRVAGRTVSTFLMNALLNAPASGGSGGGAHVHFSVSPSSAPVSFDISLGSFSSVTSAPSAAPARAASRPASAGNTGGSFADPNESELPKNNTASGKSAAPAPAAGKGGEYTLADVAKHNTEKDCWVVVNGDVLDVTKFLPDHPGGKKAILLYAGKDATEEFNMLHEKNVVIKYAPDAIIGKLKQ